MPFPAREQYHGESAPKTPTAEMGGRTVRERCLLLKTVVVYNFCFICLSDLEVCEARWVNLAPVEPITSTEVVEAAP